MKIKLGVLGVLFSLSCFIVSADETRPITKPNETKTDEKKAEEKKAATSEVNWPAKTWQMPAEKVEGSRYSDLDEEELIGSYLQPRWTAHRRFAGTRVYVLPEKEIDAEFWAIAKIKKHGEGAEYLTQWEVEFGLPNRFQLDLYFITRTEHAKGEKDKTFYDFAPELRYALADWGELWGNPTLYLEYKHQQDAPDVVETKILFGGEIASRWHWGTNFVWEQETSEERECVLEMTNAISYSMLDEKFSVGLEAKCEIANVAGARDHWENNCRIGPSIQYRPLKRMHIDFASIFGFTETSRLADVFLVVGFEF